MSCKEERTREMRGEKSDNVSGVVDYSSLIEKKEWIIGIK